MALHPLARCEQPAVALYEHWKSVLDFEITKSLGYGQPGWMLGFVDDTSVIGFGQRGWKGEVYPHFLLKPDGRFRIEYMHGSYRRNAIQRYVPFLRYSHLVGRYQWFIDFEKDPKYDWYPWTNLLDWKNPRHYVSEDQLGCRTWRHEKSWCEVGKVEGQWRITLAADQGGVPPSDAMVEDWRKYEALVERRYRLARRAALKESEPVSVRTPTMLTGNKPIPTEQAVSRLLALMEADAPAKTTPLRRPKEACNGTDHMAATHQL